MKQFEMQPVTPDGGRFVELAEKHAAEVAPGAAERDREGTFPVDAFESMKASGFMGATIPAEFGGLGVNSTHDIAIGLSRLAKGDASVAIAANMHLAFGLAMGWLRRAATAAGDSERAEALGGLLATLGSGVIAMANTTEPGTDLRHPLVEATRADGGWVLNGTKIFGTLSEVADLCLVSCRLADSNGGWTAANAFVFNGTPGRDIAHDWNALGMRASGSHAINYTDCFVPDNLLFESGPWGAEDELGIVIATVANAGLLAPYLGIAEAARDAVVEMAKTRTKAPSDRPIAVRPGIQLLVAEMDTDILICRAVLERVTRLLDEVICTGPVESATYDQLLPVMHQFQCCKLIVNRKAVEVVDRAMSVSGGAGYMSGNPLSRAYRDVRAGPFMQPYAPSEAWELIGRIALDLDPEITC